MMTLMNNWGLNRSHIRQLCLIGYIKVWFSQPSCQIFLHWRALVVAIQIKKGWLTVKNFYHHSPSCRYWRGSSWVLLEVRWVLWGNGGVMVGFWRGSDRILVGSSSCTSESFKNLLKQETTSTINC